MAMGLLSGPAKIGTEDLDAAFDEIQGMLSQMKASLDTKPT